MYVSADILVFMQLLYTDSPPVNIDAPIDEKGKNKSNSHVSMQIPGVTPPLSNVFKSCTVKGGLYAMKGATKGALRGKNSQSTAMHL